MMKLRSLAVAAAATLLVACEGNGTEETPPQGPSNAAEAAPQVPAATPGNGANGDVRLTRERVDQWIAAIEELGRAVQTNPEIADAIGVNADESEEEAAARLRDHPPIVAALRQHEFTPESYVGFMNNMIRAMGAHSLREQGQAVPYEVNDQDVQFIAENHEWMQERWSRLEQMQ